MTSTTTEVDSNTLEAYPEHIDYPTTMQED